MSAQLQAEGRFKARIFDAGVGETKNENPQWVARFGAYAFEQRGDDGSTQWADLDDWYEITGYLILGYWSKETQQMEFATNVDNLKEALGWDPSTGFAGLQQLNPVNQDVQIVTQWDEYEGKNILKVAFVNHIDSQGPGVRKLDQDRLQQLDSKWGAKFRAKFGMGGGGSSPAAPAGGAPPAQGPPAGGQQTPQQGPPPQSAPQQGPPQQGQGPPQQGPPAQPAQQGPPPAAAGPGGPQQPAQGPPAPGAGQQPASGAPAATAPASSTGAQQQPEMTGAHDLIDLGGQQAPPPPGPQDGYQSQKGGQPTATQQDAWGAFANARPSNMADQQFFNEWWRILQAGFGDQVDMDALTASQWAWVRDWAPGSIIPF